MQEKERSKKGRSVCIQFHSIFTIIIFTNKLMNMTTVSGDLHKDTSSILFEEKLDEEELLDCRDNKRKILSMFIIYYK